MRQTSADDIKSILAQYDLNSEDCCVEEVTAGHICEVFLISAMQKDFVLRVRPTVFRPHHLSSDHQFIKYLSADGFPAPQPIPCSDGSTFGCLSDGRGFELLQYIPHDSTLEDRRYQEVFPEVAAFLGDYHHLAAAYRRTIAKPGYVGTIPISVQNKYFLEQNQSRIEEYLEGGGSELRSAAAILGRRLSYLERIQKLMNQGPQVVAHNDFYGNNILFNGDRIIGLVDFDFCRTASYIVDLIEGVFAVVIWEPEAADYWGLDPDREFDFDAGRRFVSIYEEHSEISPDPEAVLAMLEVKVISLAFYHGFIMRADQKEKRDMLSRAHEISLKLQDVNDW